jgi:hypothetical protein
MSGTRFYYPILLIALVLAGCQQKPAEEKAEPATLTAERSGPAISVAPTAFDFGRMNQNDSQSTEVVIKNVGTDSLHIHNIIAACGCTVTSLQTRVIGPGKSTVLGIHFDSKKLSGHQNKTVIIESDDPENPQFDIAITADVHLPIQTNPQKHFLSNRSILLGEQWTEQITFSTGDVPELLIEVVEYDAEVFSVKIENGIDGDSQASIMTVATQPNLVARSYSDIIRLKTNVELKPRMDISVLAIVLGDLKVDKNLVNFGLVEPGQLLDYTVTVILTSTPVDFKVTGATIDFPDLEVEVEEIRPNEETRVHITGKAVTADHPDAKNRSRIRGTLHISTDLGTQPEMEVPVMYLLKK